MARDQISRFGISADEAAISPNTMLSQCGGDRQMAWLESRRTGIAPMSLRTRIVASAALATASFLFAPSALAASHPVQVSGTKLKSALLPASSLGSDWEWDYTLWSKGIWHFKATDHVATMSCSKLELSTVLLHVGESANAVSVNDNTNPWPYYPNVQFFTYQAVYQFPGTKAARTFFNQAKAKYAACKDFKVNALPGDPIPGGGVMETVNQTITHNKVGQYQAFQVGQLADLSDSPGFTVDPNTTVALAGTDVFIIDSVGGTNDSVPASMMLKLINRVKKLR